MRFGFVHYIHFRHLEHGRSFQVRFDRAHCFCAGACEPWLSKVSLRLTSRSLHLKTLMTVSWQVVYGLPSEVSEGSLAGQADYIPVFLSDMPTYFYNKSFPVDVALISVSPPGWICRLMCHRISYVRVPVDSIRFLLSFSTQLSEMSSITFGNSPPYTSKLLDLKVT